MISLRPYQSSAIDAILDYWSKGGGNPLVEMATGTGKSMVIADLVRRLRDQYPLFRVLMLVHVKELVEQNYHALMRNYPNANAGIYAAGLGKRDAHHPITFASVQSVFRRGSQLGSRDLVIIDEAHLVPPSGQGMYMQLLSDLRDGNPDLRVAGFTATPYRLGTGRLDGEGGLFDETVFSFGIAEGIEGGFLSPLISKATAAQVDVSEVKRSGGEFVAASLEAAADRITAEACDEIISFGQDRQAWLVFCSGVGHAARVRDAMRARGVSAEMVTGDTPAADRARIFRDYRAGMIRCLAGANVFTTGFDAPVVDLIAMLRPTLSTSLYVQMVGRGTRLHHGKENCLVLDFAGNVRRHGPVDNISSERGKKAGEGKASVDSVLAKECPECSTLAALNQRECKTCGHQWTIDEKAKHEGQADGDAAILSTEKLPPKMIPVVDWNFKRWQKSGSPDSVRVTFYAGVQSFPEWLAFEWSGRGREHACSWWAQHKGATPFPKTTDEALERLGELTMPLTISVKPNGKYFDIIGRTFPKAANHTEPIDEHREKAVA